MALRNPSKLLLWRALDFRCMHEPLISYAVINLTGVLQESLSTEGFIGVSDAIFVCLGSERQVELRENFFLEQRSGRWGLSFRMQATVEDFSRDYSNLLRDVIFLGPSIFASENPRGNLVRQYELHHGNREAAGGYSGAHRRGRRAHPRDARVRRARRTAHAHHHGLSEAAYGRAPAAAAGPGRRPLNLLPRRARRLGVSGRPCGHPPHRRAPRHLQRL